MIIGKVEGVWTNPMTNKPYVDIRIIKHNNKLFEGGLYPATNCSEDFKIISNENISFKELMEFKNNYCLYYELNDCCEECNYYRKGCYVKFIDDNFYINKL